MNYLVFSKCANALTDEDLNALEQFIGTKLPEDFRLHYLLYNGGTPSLDWFPAQSGWEPIWVHRFLSIDSTNCTSNTSIANIYRSMTKKGIIQISALPFAIDPGSNFLCLDLDSGTVFYHANDVFDQNLNTLENQKKAQRNISKTFATFIKELVSEDDAYS